MLIKGAPGRYSQITSNAIMYNMTKSSDVAYYFQNSNQYLYGLCYVWSWEQVLNNHCYQKFMGKKFWEAFCVRKDVNLMTSLLC